MIAGLASELGALTIAVVTKPFKFEGRRRQLQAERGLAELRDAVDTVITIPNERLLATIDRRTPLPEAFCAADDVLRQAIQGISDLILVPGMINLDFADVKTIMSGMGFAIMGTGMGDGETRAIDAANRAVSSPLLEDASVKGARGVIINITGGNDFSLAEVNDAASIIQEAAHEDANIIFGAVIDPAMNGKVKITVIATGFDRPDAKLAAPASQTPVDLNHYTAWRQEATLDRAVAGGGRIAISRRPVVDLPGPRRVHRCRTAGRRGLAARRPGIHATTGGLREERGRRKEEEEKAGPTPDTCVETPNSQFPPPKRHRRAKRSGCWSLEVRS